jgi:hypothetical protein
MTETIKLRSTFDYNGNLYCFETTIEILEEEFGKIAKSWVTEQSLFEVRKIVYADDTLKQDDVVAVNYNGEISPIGIVKATDGDFVFIQTFGQNYNTWMRKSDLIQIRENGVVFKEDDIAEIINEMGVELGYSPNLGLEDICLKIKP